jgi:integrase
LDSATEIKTVAGEETAVNSNSEAKIIEFLWWMKKQGYKETTIVSRGTRLRRLVDLGADLTNSESVKETIARQEQWKDSMKEVVVFAYDLFAKWSGIKWQRPRYKAQRQLPFIPQEREIDDVIAGCNEEIALFLQIGKDTGARAGEIYRLEWTDIDFEGRAINIIAEKGSNPRIFRLSNKLLNMLSSAPKDSQRVFTGYKNLNNLRRSFERQRNRTARRLGNPRLKKITFHTLRHWKGSMEYHNTKDILHVMQVLGHKNIKNTLLYTQLIQVEKDDQYVCKVAKTQEEIVDLVSQGFEFVCYSDDLKFFRKRK